MDNYDGSRNYIKINSDSESKRSDKLLWTGDSAFCGCGHHVEYHNTRVLLASVWTKNPKDILYNCRELTKVKNVHVTDSHHIERWHKVTTIAETSISNTFNEGTGFWRNVLGVNPIPYDTANVFNNPEGGQPLLRWSNPLEGQTLGLKDRPMTDEEFGELKRQNKFQHGIAIIPGKIWHRKECENIFLYVIDIDTAKLMKAFLTTEDGRQLSLRVFCEGLDNRTTRRQFMQISPNRLLKKATKEYVCKRV